MPRKEKECRKKWDKITFSKNEGEKYHKSECERVNDQIFEKNGKYWGLI